MKIDEYKFGSFRIDGKTYLDDIKIVNDKVRYWQTREKHLLKLSEVQELLDANPQHIIIGTGANGTLKVPEEIKTKIILKRIHLTIDKTDNACKSFNILIQQKKKVAAILHATC